MGSLKEVRFSGPTGLCWADGVLYVADTDNHRIVAIAGGEATLVAGAELTGDAAVEGDYRDGQAEIACFSSPQGVAVGDDSTVYVADTGTTAFTDVAADQYYANAVAWAAQNGIVSGTSTTTFAPNAAITREQMATILMRFCENVAK